MGRWPVYLISALVVLSMAFLLFQSLIFPPGGTTSSSTDTAAVKYTSPSGLWGVTFPAQPQYSTNVFRDDIGLPTVTIEGATLDKGGELYLVRLYHYHSETKKELKPFVESIVHTWTKKFPTLKLIRQDEVTFQNSPALSFAMVGDNLEMLGEAFGSEDYLFLVAWVGNMNDKEVERVGETHFGNFLNSFIILPPQ